MHHMIMHVLRTDHQIADIVGIFRHLYAYGVFHRAYRRQPMHHSADTADALRERPGIAWIAVLHDLLEAAHHGAGTESRLIDQVAIFALRVLGGDGCGLYAEVPLNSGHRIDYDVGCYLRCHLGSPWNVFRLCVDAKPGTLRCCQCYGKSVDRGGNGS